MYLPLFEAFAQVANSLLPSAVTTNAHELPRSLEFLLKSNPRGDLDQDNLTGRVYGRLVQKNFPTRSKAEVFMDGLITAATQGKSGPAKRMARTIFETDQQLHEAELAYRRLTAAVPSASLLSAVDFFLEHKTVAVVDIAARDAVAAFIECRL